MAIKSLFDKHERATKIVSLTNKTDASEDVESTGYYSAEISQKNKFEPHVDYTSASNFARFGSAEKYYTDTITNIYSKYPFDGSQKEQTQWAISASGIDQHIFENEYPRTNGYVNIGNSYGALISGPTDGYSFYGSDEYIYIKAGPNPDPDGSSKKLSQIFNLSSSNFYNSSENRTSNLSLDGETGICVEFWLKKDNFTSQSSKQVIFDLWNSASFGTDTYGRYRIEVRGTDTTKLYLEVMSGSSGSLEIEIGDALTVTDGQWHHYGITTKNVGSSLTTNTYLDGALNSTVVSGSSIGTVTGSIIGYIGALGTSVSGTNGATGWGKLSGSLDEMRIWKTYRTDKDIGRNWFTQVGGGTNEDDANTDLGAYYKFNEGITLTASVDSRVLDYSGRFSDGAWTGYTSTSRNTGSAIVDSLAAKSEFKDPIIYSFHPAVVALLSAKQEEGKLHDQQNPASIYHSIPGWITEEDEKIGGDLLSLTQIVSSFFDSIYLKIQELPRLKDVQYLSSSEKPYPFTNKSLESLGFTAPEMFVEADVIEAISSRNETENFEEKIYNIKNTIYQNVYNNLLYIYKTKGTMKSFRNLLRCYGIDEELVRINLYVDGATYELEDDYKLHALEKKFVNFAKTDRFQGTVYQTASSDISNSTSFITASTFDHPMTIESQFIIPKKFPIDSTLYFRTDFISASLFGMHEAVDDGTDYTWAAGDDCNFQVYVVKEKLNSGNAKFVLKSTTDNAPFPTLETSVYKEIYENTNWNIAVRLKQQYELLDTGSAGLVASDNPYTLEFYGVETEGDLVRNEFLLTSSLSYASGSGFIKSNKRFYAGSHRTNFTGSTLEQTDVKSTENRVWVSYLDNETIKVHAKDTTNYGTKSPYRNVYAEYNEIGVQIPEVDTLTLHWGYDTLSSSDAGVGPGYTAGFTVDDISSGSSASNVTYGALDDILKKQHPGRGHFFLANDTDVITKEYVSNAKLQGPETMQGDDLVSIINGQDDQIYTRESRPLTYRYAIEKGMQQVISDEMIDVFGSIVDFNNLIGEPINRYRLDYHDLGKLRQIFFSRIKNTPNLIKYVEFYKWIDGAITTMVQQLVPASARFSDSVSTVVESHILERNKYWTKFPTIELEEDIPEDPMRGIGELKYPWRTGHAPINGQQNTNCFWWRNRAVGSEPPLNPDPSSIRAPIFSVAHSAFDRKFNSPISFAVDNLYITDDDSTNIGAIKEVIKFGSNGFISISSTDTAIIDVLEGDITGCDDE